MLLGTCRAAYGSTVLVLLSDVAKTDFRDLE